MTIGPYFIDGQANRRDIRSQDGSAAGAGAPEGAERSSQDGNSTAGRSAANSTGQAAKAAAPAQNQTRLAPGSTAPGERDAETAEGADAEFIDAPLSRSDVRRAADGSVQDGARLNLTITVNGSTGGVCAPLVGAKVDLWHANAVGKYSGFQTEGTLGENWLRGYQVTDGSGKVTFETIWPGWYPGRAVHMHVKVRMAAMDFTSQFFFDEAMSRQVYAQAPYAGHGATPDTPNARDGIYNQGGDKMLVLTEKGDGSYTGSKTIVLTSAGS